MLKTIPLIFLVSSLTVASQLLLKKGLMAIGGLEINSFLGFLESVLKLAREKYLLAGIFFAMLAAFVWLIIISKKDLTTAFPLASGIFYILLFVFSWFFLKESISSWKIIGTVFILLGIASLTLKG